MFRLFRAFFRLNLGGYIYIYCNAVKEKISFAKVQPEEGSKMPKAVNS